MRFCEGSTRNEWQMYQMSNWRGCEYIEKTEDHTMTTTRLLKRQGQSQRLRGGWLMG